MTRAATSGKAERNVASTFQPAASNAHSRRRNGTLTWPERALYLLREALGYTALLLGMSDANIDQLHKFAEKRIRYFSNPSSQLPDIRVPSQRLDRIAAWR
jgi:hypothetical protein